MQFVQCQVHVTGQRSLMLSNDNQCQKTDGLDFYRKRPVPGLS